MMFDLEFSGPWPRALTENEIEDVKARAMIKLGEKIGEALPGAVFNLGDQFNFSYTLHFGDKAELKEAEKMQCGAVPPGGGPPCRLDRGHTCQHSSVQRW